MMASNRNPPNLSFDSMREEKQRDIARNGGESGPHEKRGYSKDHEADIGRETRRAFLMRSEASHGIMSSPRRGVAGFRRAAVSPSTMRWGGYEYFALGTQEKANGKSESHRHLKQSAGDDKRW
jgi:hypothetical protein